MTESDVPAGWYPNPGDDGAAERYWDGSAWTHWTRSASQQVSAPGGGSTNGGDAQATSTLAAAEDEEYIPAGWYPDPDTNGATARYWDGNDWTERTRATLRPTPGPLAGQASSRTGSATLATSPSSSAPTAVAAVAAGPTAAVVSEQSAGGPAAAEVASSTGSVGSVDTATATAAVAEDDAGHIPADWYPDPDDGGLSERYWDGTDWTEQTRPKGGADVSASEPVEAATASAAESPLTQTGEPESVGTDEAAAHDAVAAADAAGAARRTSRLSLRKQRSRNPPPRRSPSRRRPPRRNPNRQCLPKPSPRLMTSGHPNLCQCLSRWRLSSPSPHPSPSRKCLSRRP